MLILLRLLHVGFAVFWGGSVIFLNAFIGPAVEAAGPSGPVFMRALAKRRHLDVMLIVGAIVMLSGLELMRRDSNNFDPGWFRSHFGMALGVGMVATLIGYALMLIGIRPAMMRLGQLGTQMEVVPADQRGTLMASIGTTRERLVKFSVAGMLCMITAIVTMATARYL